MKRRQRFEEDQDLEGGDGDNISSGSFEDSDEEDQDQAKPQDDDKKTKAREEKKKKNRDDKKLMGTDAGARGPDAAIVKIKTAIESKNTELQLGWLDLQGLQFMKDFNWPNLEEIYLQRNMISNIDLLDGFPMLKKIDASNNYIEDVNLYLPRLETLDLKNNYLKKFPILEGMVKLKNLNLKGNQLVNFKHVLIHFTPNIQMLNLEGNQIYFDNVVLFEDFLHKLQTLSHLRSLYVADNPFFMPENLKIFTGIDIKEELINQLRNLTTFNGDTMDVVAKQMEKAKLQEAIRLNNAAGAISAEPVPIDKKKASKIKKAKGSFIPTLDELLGKLEDANREPAAALDHLSSLASDADVLISKLHLVEAQFAPGQDDGQIEENILTFMQSSQLLIDNSYELQGIMLSILAKMSIVSYKDFGLHCFSTLRDMMKAGREMENSVLEVLEKEVISKLNPVDPLSIPASLLQGLYDLVEETKIVRMLDSLYSKCFPAWMQLYSHKIDEFRASNNVMGNDPHYDAIIQLLATSVQDNELNISNFLASDVLIKGIVKVIKNSTWEHDRYIPILICIANLSNNDSEDKRLGQPNKPLAADIFHENLIHTMLLTQIKKSLTIYKKNHSLFDESSSETVEQQIHKYKTLAAEITSLGGLLQCSTEKRSNIYKDPVIEDLIQIMSHPQTDPILLTAICTFALDLFECPQIRNDPVVMAPFHKNMSDMKYLIPYLGFDSYFILLEKTKPYHHAFNPAYRLNPSDNDAAVNDIGDDINEVVEDVHGDEEEIKERNIENSLKHLDDPIVKELFVSIIKLIRYFCAEANDNKQNNLFRAISDTLNEIERETALFKCLTVPDDDVKLAVVQCLFVVPLAQLDEKEIKTITALLSKCNNIGAGRTEIVISVIFWICCKLVFKDQILDSDEPDVAEMKKQTANTRTIFQERLGEQTVNDALNILQRNLERVVVHEDDDQEKYTLSLSILNFLKASTHDDARTMRKYMVIDKDEKKKEIFKSILRNEDLYSLSQVYTIPIDIESTKLGREMSCLVNTIQTKRNSPALEPYSDVSLRVIMRMADLLMYRHECQHFDMQDSDIAKSLADHQRRHYKKKKQKELKYWVDQSPCFMEELHKNDPNADRREREQLPIEDLKKQHEFFEDCNGIVLLTDYLTKQFPVNEEYLQMLSDQCFQESEQELAEKKKNKDKETCKLAQKILDKKKEVERDFEELYINTPRQRDLEKMTKKDRIPTLKEKRWLEIYGKDEDFPPKKGVMTKQQRADELKHYAIRSVMLEKYFQQHPQEEAKGTKDEKKTKKKSKKTPEQEEDKLSDDQIQENKTPGEKDIADSVTSMLFGDSQETKAASTKGGEESDEEEGNKKFNECRLKETTDKQIQDFYNIQQNEMLGRHLVAERNLDATGVPYVEREQVLNEEIAGKKIKVGKQYPKLKRSDGFANKKLRCLTIAAYLRCLHGAIEYAPDDDHKNFKSLAIEKLKSPAIFRTITQLCDSTDWDEEASIASKYLRVMRHVLKLPTKEDEEPTDPRRLIIYQLLAIVLQKTLGNIIIKMNKDIQLTEGDQITQFEICLIFFIIINQSKNFKFSEHNLEKQHLINEHLLLKDKEENGQTPQKIAFEEEHKIYREDDRGPWPLKCKHTMKPKKPYTLHNYNDFLPELREKRSPQEEIVDQMLTELFSKQTIFSLVDILFKDMKEDYKMIEHDQKKPQEESDDANEGAQEGDDQQDDQEVEEEGLEEYMSLKGTLTIERIKDVVGEIMGSCRNLKYEVLNKIMRGVIFEQKKLRESFMQEILKAQENAVYKSSLEEYLLRRNYTVFAYYEEQYNRCARCGRQPPQNSPSNEKICRCKKRLPRIINISWIDCNNSLLDIKIDDPSNDKKIPSEIKDELDKNHGKYELKHKSTLGKDPTFSKRLLVLSNHGLQVMRDIEEHEKCHTCSKDKFCPRGPYQDVCVKFGDIKSVVNFAQLPQRIVIIYQEPYIDSSGSVLDHIKIVRQMTCNFPSFTKTSKVYSNLTAIMKGLKFELKSQIQEEQSNQETNVNPTQTGGPKETAAGDHQEEEDAHNHDDKMKIKYLDKVVQLELKLIIQLIFKNVKSQDIAELKVIEVLLIANETIDEDHRQQMIKEREKDMSKATGKKLVKRKAAATPGMTPVDLGGGVFDFMGGSSSGGQGKSANKADTALICVVNGHLVILKNKWYNWKFGKNNLCDHGWPEYKRDLKNRVLNHEAEQSASIGDTYQEVDSTNKKEIQAAMKVQCKKFKTDIFEVESLIQVSDYEEEGGKGPHKWVPKATEAKVYKGAVAHAELTLGDSNLKIILGFYGDMERQKFIDDVANSPKIQIDDQDDEAENQAKSEGLEGSDEGSDGEGEDIPEEESDDGKVNAAVYD